MIILFRVQTTFLPTKIRKSEGNTKQKRKFLILFPNESIFGEAKVRISEGKTKGKLIFLLFFQSRRKSNSWILTSCWHSDSCACR